MRFCPQCGRFALDCTCPDPATERLRTQLMSAGSEIERLTKENAELRVKCGDFEERLDRLHERYDAAESERDEYQRQIERQEEAIDRSDVESDRIRDDRIIP